MNDSQLKLLRTLFEIAPCGILIADGEARILKANPAFMAMFETSPAELAQAAAGTAPVGEGLQDLIRRCRAHAAAPKTQ
ncbi:MAG: PAS domain-containing protein, partial [Desulfobacterales bacterium]